MPHPVILLTGGARSGKSKRALELALGYPNPAFLATAEATDPEMSRRIMDHQAEREGQFFTFEEPVNLTWALNQMPKNTGVVVIDCLTLWVNNLLFQFGEQTSYSQMDDFLNLLEYPPVPLVIVTNELGMGLVPPDKLSRVFRDLAGRLNQQVADRADEVYLMVCGLPVAVKTLESK